MENKNAPLRILLIEDSDTDAYILEKALRRHGGDGVICTRVDSAAAGEAALERGDVDLLLLDLGLPDTAGPQETYEKMKKWAGKLPVIIMTNLKDHDLARGMVHEGAADFLNKDLITADPEQITRAVDFSLERHGLHRKIVEESREKDAILNCFMGGYSSSSSEQ